MQIEVNTPQNLTVGNIVHIVPFGVLEDINFKSEMDGNSSTLTDLGRLSKRIKGLLLLGAVSDNCSLKKCSVFVFENGKLKNISDMNGYNEKFSATSGLNIINFNGAKIGILVGRDIYSPPLVNALCLCGCNGIINLYADLSGNKSKISAEFYSYVYGIDFVVCAPDKSFAYVATGEEFLWKEGGNLPFKRLYSEIKKKGMGKSNF